MYYGHQVVRKEDRGIVEDVIQDFFIWLAEHPEKVAGIRNLEGYMFQSVRRNLHSKIGAVSSSRHSLDRFMSLTLPLQETVSESPEQFHIREEETSLWKNRIHTELDLLPPAQREVLYLRYFEDKSYSEIAAILSISEQVAYNYAYRAMKKLKDQLQALKILPFFLLVWMSWIG